MKTSGLRRLVGTITIGLLGAISLSGCSPANFSFEKEEAQQGIPVPTPSPYASPTPNPTLKTFTPALAVRDSSCLACHADIRASFVTDFGYGDPWYMNKDGHQGYAAGRYNANTWQGLKSVEGQVVVPDAITPDNVVAATLPAGATQPPAGSVDLVEFLTMKTVRNFSAYWNFELWGLPVPSDLSLTANVHPPAGKDKVVSKSYVYIGAPTSAQILALAPEKNDPAPWIVAKGAAGVPAGFTVSTGSGGSTFVTNSGNIDCSNKDLVVKGTLLLRNAQILAEKGGCRIYVTGPVFLQGPVTYLNSGAEVDSTNNLQITSATAIMIGVGTNGTVCADESCSHPNPLKNRLMEDVRGLYLRSASTDGAYNTLAQAIFNEGNGIGTALLNDASVPNGLPTAKSAFNQTRAKVDYKHILLNAPMVHSRYLGSVSGVIVAESAIFSLGDFSFSFDPVFSKVPVLPALPFDILCTQDSETGCNPTQP